LLIIFFPCSGDEESAAQPAAAPPVTTQSNSAPPKIESPQDLQPQQEQYYQPETAIVERATDPRKQPSSAPVFTGDDDHDPDRDFARNGGGIQHMHDSSSRDDTAMRDTRPNPNKHEDG
jgi:hypothetical protein